MKKLFVLFAFACLTLLSACKHRGGDDGPLAGTMWSHSEQRYNETDGNYTYTITAAFTSETKMQIILSWSSENSGDDSDAETYTYKYNPPKVTLTDDFGESITGKIDGNKMTVTEDGETYTLTKQ